MKGRGKIGARRVVEAMLVVSAVVALAGVFSAHKSATAPERAVEDCEVVGDEHELLVTGYCNCGKCCGWRKKWFFFGEPVYNYGDLKGTPKKVGVTASGAVEPVPADSCRERLADAFMEGAAEAGKD